MSALSWFVAVLVRWLAVISFGIITLDKIKSESQSAMTGSQIFTPRQRSENIQVAR